MLRTSTSLILVATIRSRYIIKLLRHGFELLQLQQRSAGIYYSLCLFHALLQGIRKSSHINAGARIGEDNITVRIHISLQHSGDDGRILGRITAKHLLQRMCA
ncbi:hypothetical protein D3C85_1695470 [compost metagenome]